MSIVLAASLAAKPLWVKHRRCRQPPDLDFFGALGGIRTPNLLIRSQMLYPLGYERSRT